MLMISLDPYLHEWDERFHALVAKNMISFPFKPMLFQNPYFPYDYKDWSYNHIWLHKQPLFLWQMALSMKLFGVNVMALRFPSVIMGTTIVWLVYDISRKWINNDKIAFVAAYFSCFSYYSLELISGRMSTDHNDVAFLFYVTCSFWAFTRFIFSDMKIKWALLIGVFVGMAVLNKWLTAFLIYGGWGVYLVLSASTGNNLKKIGHFIISLITAFIPFLPWQFYIKYAFPKESIFTFQYNQRHFLEDFGHPGSIFFHINFMPIAYDYILLLFLLLGLLTILSSKNVNRKLTYSFLAMIFVLYVFFSFFVKTKMPTFTFPVFAPIIIISAFGFNVLLEFISKKYKSIFFNKNLVLVMLTILVGIFALKPWMIAYNRSIENVKRNNKIYNTQLYKGLDESLMRNGIIINCRLYENIDLMFYRDVTAYHFYPDKQTIDTIESEGHLFAAFDYSDQQKLPDYIKDNPSIIILQERPR
jgi:4-amino-4-deoxy-L-arabinose transferase